MSSENNSEPKDVSPNHPSLRKPRQKKPRGDGSAMSNLPVSRQRYVMEVLSGKSQTAAYQTAYPASNTKHSNTKASELHQQPAVQAAFREKLYQLYPNLDERIASRLSEILEAPIIYRGIEQPKKRRGKCAEETSTPPQKGVSVGEFLQVAAFVKDVCGYSAPKLTGHLRISKKLLPE